MMNDRHTPTERVQRKAVNARKSRTTDPAEGQVHVRLLSADSNDAFFFVAMGETAIFMVM